MRFRKAVHPRVFSKEDEVYALAYDGVLFSMKRGERFPSWSTRVGGRGNVGVWGYEGGLFVPLDSGFCKSYTFAGREQWDFSSKAISEEKIYLEKKRAKLAKHVEDERMNARTKGRPEDLEYIKGYQEKIVLVDKERALLAKRNRGGFRAEPTFGGSKMFVGNVDFQLYCLDSYSGLPIWSYPCEGQLTKPAVVRGEDIWQLDQRGHLHHLDVGSGVGRVFERGVEQVVMVSSDTVLYVTESGELNLRHKTGQAVVQIDGPFVKKGRFLGHGEERYLFWVGKGGELKAYSLSTERVMN
jgi:outer membrane protein assembly factor BamB